MIQNCACRIILKADRYASVTEMHTCLNLMTLQERRAVHMATECHRNIYNREAGLHNVFQDVDENRVRATRSEHTCKMKVPDVKTVTGRKAFSYRGPCFWNGLDDDTRIIENKATFKNHINKALCRGVNHPE